MGTRRWMVLGWTMGVMAVAGGAAAQDALDPGERREQLARLAYLGAEEALAGGLSQPELVYQWSRRWLDARRANAPAGEADALREHLGRMRGLDQKTDALISSGMLLPSLGTAVDYYVAEAEFWVAAVPGPERDAG